LFVDYNKWQATGRSNEVPFYAFANIKQSGLSSEAFSERLLTSLGIASCPGLSFGKNGEGYVRFCFAQFQDLIRKA